MRSYAFPLHKLLSDNVHYVSLDPRTLPTYEPWPQHHNMSTPPLFSRIYHVMRHDRSQNQAADTGRNPETHKRDRVRVAVASTIGTTIEFYDFFFATAAVAVFPFLFFPKTEDPTVALPPSFADFGLAFIARPLGSLLFGHFGDRIGRKATLVGALLTMGIATFIIGVFPTYQTAGIIAPALLVLMRFCQGLGLGGEWSGAALLASETAEEGKRASAPPCGHSSAHLSGSCSLMVSS